MINSELYKQKVKNIVKRHDFSEKSHHIHFEMVISLYIKKVKMFGGMFNISYLCIRYS